MLPRPAGCPGLCPETCQSRRLIAVSPELRKHCRQRTLLTSLGVAFPTYPAPEGPIEEGMANRVSGKTSKRRRTAKQTHLRLLRLELLADAHLRSSWRAGNSARMMRATAFARAVSSRLRALAMSKAALAIDDDKGIVAEAV
jgi:hypothetical protein